MKRTLMSIALMSMVTSAFAGPSATAVDTPNNTTSQAVCDAAVGGGGKMVVFGGSGAVVTSPVFIRNGFDFQCSANTHVSFREVSSNLAAVGSGSAKGNQSYSGHSGGGAIGPHLQCTGTNKACTTGDVETAIVAAVAAGSS